MLEALRTMPLYAEVAIRTVLLMMAVMLSISIVDGIIILVYKIIMSIIRGVPVIIDLCKVEFLAFLPEYEHITFNHNGDTFEIIARGRWPENRISVYKNREDITRKIESYKISGMDFVHISVMNFADGQYCEYKEANYADKDAMKFVFKCGSQTYEVQWPNMHYGFAIIDTAELLHYGESKQYVYENGVDITDTAELSHWCDHRRRQSEA